MSRQRIPEKCPWCGAELLVYDNGWGCACGTQAIGEWERSSFCEEQADTPDAIAYRRTLAARKRLSQHTGVPLREIGEPSWMADGQAWWDGYQVGLCHGGSLRNGLVVSGWCISGTPAEWREEAARRIREGRKA